MNEAPETITMTIGAAQVIVPKNAAVRAFLQELLNGHRTAASPTAAPRIGEAWPGQGGINGGLVRGDDGAPDYYVILAEPKAEKIKWNDAVAWAKQIEVEGHADFALPTRREQAILYGNLKEHFEDAWYWSGEQHAADGEYAWYQYFGYGYQNYGRKSSNIRARAVRRVVIQ